MRSRPAPWLVVAVAVLLAGTAALAVLLSRAAAVLASKNEIIVDRSEPAIVALQSMRDDLREEHSLAGGWILGAPGDPSVLRARLDDSRRDLEKNRRTYFALPTAPGEAPNRTALAASLDRFAAMVDRARSLPPGRNDQSAVDLYELDAAAAQVGGDLGRATGFSADEARAAAGDALAISRRFLPLVIVLGILTTAAAVGTIALTYRSLRNAEAMEDRSRRALENRAQELEAFAGRVAHDLLNPLTTVGLGLDLAQRRASATNDAITNVAIARSLATLQRIRGFVGDLLEFARAGARPLPGVCAPVDEIVREVATEFEPIARESSVDLQVEPVPSVGVRCSPGVLTSLVANLLQNGIRYVGRSDIRRIVVRALDLGKEVRVEVEDTGPGVSPADRERLFDPFVGGHGAGGRGIGLDLATVRRLAEAHGGHVGVRSERERGAVFWFSLPSFG